VQTLATNNNQATMGSHWPDTYVKPCYYLTRDVRHISTPLPLTYLTQHKIIILKRKLSI